MLKYYFEQSLEKLNKNVKKTFITKRRQFNDFFMRMPEGLPRSETIKLFNNLNDKDLIEYKKYFNSRTSIHDISINDKKALHKLFNVSPKGIGKGEAMIAFLIPNARISGGSESYDVTIGSKLYEIKDYSDTAVGAIRLGVKGVTTRFDFWHQLMETIKYIDRYDNVLRDLFNQRSKKAIRSLKKIKDRKMSLLSGEFSSDDFESYINFYFTLKAIIENYLGSEKTEIAPHGKEFTQATFRGPNVKPETVAIEPVSKSEIKNKKIEILDKVKTKDYGDFENIIPQLQRIKYIREPEELLNDINGAAKTVTKASGGKSIQFVVFRPEKINITTNLVYSGISQGAIKVLESTIAEAKLLAKQKLKIKKEAKTRYEKEREKIMKKTGFSKAKSGKLAAEKLGHEHMSKFRKLKK